METPNRIEVSDIIIKIPITKLKKYERNNKLHPQEQVDKIKRSIEAFGFRNPVLVDKELNIIAGHGRLAAAKQLNMSQVPCIIIDNLTKEQTAAFRIMDNRSTVSEWDLDALKLEFSALDEADFDLDLTGFDFDEIVDITADHKGSGDIEEVEADDAESIKTDIKEGDVFEIGKHKLMCGNSITNYKEFIKEDKIDLLFTDPPYGISVVANNGKIGGDVLAKNGVYMPVIGDGAYFNPSFLLNIGVNQVIWGANYFHDNLPLGTRWLVWDKDRPEGTTFSDCELAWTNNKGIAITKYKCTWHGMIREGESDKRAHPTQKPIKICSEIVKDFSKENETVLDLFGGSGSTMVACEQLNRVCYMMELDERYCQVIINRMLKLNPSIEIKCTNREFNPTNPTK